MPWAAAAAAALSIGGSYLSSNQQAGKDKQAATQALTGYNYLTGGAGANAESGYINNGSSANNAQSQLLGLSPMTAGTQNGFQNYLNSTGYKFAMQQGTDAITGNAASKGVLNSGATGKALQTFGQGIAEQYFNNYLNQLGGVSQQGQTGLGQVAQAGTEGGNNAATMTSAAGAAQAQGTSNMFGAASSLLGIF